MDHRFQADGGGPIHAWCALDPMLIVPLIRRSACVESKDPLTSEPISLTVTPTGVTDLSPENIVVSLVAPDMPFDHDVILNFCSYVDFFASRHSGERWIADRKEMILLDASDAFEVGVRAWRAFRSSVANEP